jgi:hypothetical protein
MTWVFANVKPRLLTASFFKNLDREAEGEYF